MDISKDRSSIRQEHTTGARRGSVVQTDPLPSGAVATSDDVLRRLSVAVPDFKDVNDAARAATEAEHNMGVFEAVSLYPKAVLFSMILSMSLIMEGYDTALLGNFYGLQQFNKKFGVPVGDGTYQLTSTWQSGLQNGAQVGQILGLMVAGLIADRWGYRPALIGALFFMIAVIFLFFFAQNISILFAAELLAGFPWGAFQTLTTTYAADVTPIPLRPILTTYVNMCWVIGQLISSGILRGLLTREDNWAWRIPYAIQWIWPVPILVGVFFAPESPNWLVKKGRIDEARRSLRRLTSKKITADMIEQKVTMIRHTNELEVQMCSGTSYIDCFRGTNLRRTEIACVVWVAQVFCGIWFGGNVVYFLQLAGGFSAAQSFNFGIGTGALALVATSCAWYLLTRIGRRRLYLVGLATMFSILLVVGCLGIPKPSSTIGYVSVAFLMLFVITYDLTIGPVCYCLVAEIPSVRLRIKTVVLARNSYNVASICANFLNPPILNPLAWNLRGKGAFVWCGFCLSVLVWTFFRLPEPKGLSSGELDVLFENKVPARQFKRVDIDPFRSDTLAITEEDVSEDGSNTAKEIREKV